MTKKVMSIFLCVFILTALPHAQAMVVDMDTASGMQSSVSSQDTAGTLVIPLRITGADDLFSYQFKVAFDTSRFTFIGAEQDFGMPGEKNILTKNGGTLIGIYQLQTNPPAPDTVEFSCTITGEDAAKSVSGDGLIGVLYLTSRMRSGDSSAITISHGFLAQLNGSLEPVSSLTEGMFKTLPIVAIRNSGKPGMNLTPPMFRQEVIVSFRASTTRFSLPHHSAAPGSPLSVSIHALNGKLIAERRIVIAGTGDHRLSIDTPDFKTPSGTCVCTLRLGNTRFARLARLTRLSRTIGFP